MAARKGKVLVSGKAPEKPDTPKPVRIRRTQAQLVVVWAQEAYDGNEHSRQRLHEVLSRRCARQAELPDKHIQQQPMDESEALKEIVNMVRRHCIACMGGEAVLRVVDGRKVIEPDCCIETCDLYSIRNGEGLYGTIARKHACRRRAGGKLQPEAGGDSEEVSTSDRRSSGSTKTGRVRKRKRASQS